MKEDFRKKIYARYHSVHTKGLYGEINSDQLKAKFPVLQYYFGDQLPENKDALIIDMGCGYGDLVYWLNQKGYKNTSGIDISAEMITKGNEIGIKNTYCDDIYNVLGSNSNKYDLIFMRDILEHFSKEEILNLTGLIYSSLRMNGKLIIQVPNGQSPFMGKIFYGDITHHTAFTSSSIRQVFTNAGFSKVAIREQGPVPKNFKGRIRKVLWDLEKKVFAVLQAIPSGDSSGYFTQNVIAIIQK
jgi:2-polyprenyl-3-methyl-5-hydroxy-6-metoxy-1,4-benzoquinol methylase